MASGEIGQLVVAIEVNLEGLLAGQVTRLALLDDVGDAGSGEDGRQDAFVRGDAVQYLSGWNLARPANKKRHTEAAFPAQTFFTAEGRSAAVWPRKFLRAVVRAENDERVIGDAEVVQLLQKAANDPVKFLHAIGVETQTRLVVPTIGEVGPDMHAGRVVPEQEGLSTVVGAVDEIE